MGVPRSQREGAFVDGDPLVLSRLLSGLVSGFQAMDPAVMSDDPTESERFSLAELRALVRRTFVLA